MIRIIKWIYDGNYYDTEYMMGNYTSECVDYYDYGSVDFWL